MRSCSVCDKLQIVAGCLDDYRQLAHYHYCDNRPGPVAAIYALKSHPGSARPSGAQSVGVVVYSAPIPEVELRNVATDNFFAGFDRSTKLALINKHIRCITRLIIDPRYRGLGLASRLVRETMPEMNVPIIEAMAAMGPINPFLERAGMRACPAGIPVRSVRLIEALSTAGIEDKQLVNPQEVQRKLDRLNASAAEFIELEIRRFLQSYSRRRDMPPGLYRTKYVLGRLNTRPVYYVWFNPKFDVEHSTTDTRRESGKENR